MGIDTHALSFLKLIAHKKPFGETVTIGRQGIHLSESELNKRMRLKPDYRHETYCEALFQQYFGATRVDSIDNSAYEGASHVYNMGRELPENIRGAYDSVIDAGTLEHIYDIPQALKNCSALCKNGGQIIHIVPANNFCGHGFWQFSPELFFSLYSQTNGYLETEVLLAEVADTTKWFRVSRPLPGRRVEIRSSSKVYAMVHTTIGPDGFVHDNVQQSDYVYLWNQLGSRDSGGLLPLGASSESSFFAGDTATPEKTPIPETLSRKLINAIFPKWIIKRLLKVRDRFRPVRSEHIELASDHPDRSSTELDGRHPGLSVILVE